MPTDTPHAETGKRPPQGTRRAPWLGFVLLFGLFASLGLLSGLRADWNPDVLVAWLRGFGCWTPLVLLAVGLCAPFLMLPRWPLAVGCSMLYGLGWGALLANVASSLGAWLQFQAARRYLAPSAASWLERHGHALAELPPRSAFSLLVALRVFPFSNFVATNLAAASLPLSPKHFVAGTFIGMLPSTLLYGAWGRMASHPSPASYAAAVGLCLAAGVFAWIARRHIAASHAAMRLPAETAPVQTATASPRPNRNAPA